jgi:hypothetical protein
VVVFLEQVVVSLGQVVVSLGQVVVSLEQVVVFLEQVVVSLGQVVVWSVAGLPLESPVVLVSSLVILVAPHRSCFHLLV